MTPSDPERLAEPLTDRLGQLRHHCTYHAEVNCMVAAADVLALFAERDALATRLAAAEDEASDYENLANRAQTRATALATENQAMRAVVDAAKELPNIACLMAPYDYQPCGDCPACHFYAALASLPPVADERTEP